jgi:fructosamine-3-kinase
MLNTNFKHYLEQEFSIKITSINPLSGGDINAVYRLETKDSKYVIKVNKADAFPGLFEKEALGLKTMRDTKTIDVPEVLGYGTFQNNTYLVLEYKEQGRVSQNFWEKFGQELAAMHRHSRGSFGFNQDNYIGSLPQYNASESTASAFYIHQRLQPQFSMARNRGYEFKNIETFFKQVERVIPKEPPALIHGDLWSGNFLVNSQNKPCLIDPAVAYAPREMDLAMMKLFGGFDEVMYQTYQESFPLAKDWEDRIALWQLYYVLVHVNIFGGHYYSQAQSLMSSYY